MTKPSRWGTDGQSYFVPEDTQEQSDGEPMRSYTMPHVCPRCESDNLLDNPSFDKCMDCGLRIHMDTRHDLE